MTNPGNDKNEAPESELDEVFQGDVRIGRLITSVPRAAAAGLAFIPGLIFLVAGRAAGHIGVNAVTATVLVTFALLLTLLNIFELLGGSSARGGTSSLVYESLGARSGFIAGWALVAAYIVLYAAMAQLMARLLRELFPTLLLTRSFLGVGIILILSLIQIFRILPRQGSTLPIVILTFSALAGLMLAASPAIDGAFYQNPPAIESGDLMRTAGWLIVMFGGLEAVMASRRLIQDPSRNAPSSLLWTLVISGLALAVGLFFASGMPSIYTSGDAQLLADVIRQETPIAGWLIAAISLGSLLFSINTGLMTAARELHMLTRWGALPRNIIAVRRPFRLPPLIFVLLVILAAPIIFLVPMDSLSDAGSVFMFVPVVLINLAAIASRRSEPDRRRPFLLPYYPLAPLVAMAITVGMLLALPQEPILWGFLWLLLGLAFYEVYSRSHLIRAQEGVRVFGRSSRREKKEDSYRILVPFIAGAERRVMYELATALASQLHGELIALQVVVIPDPLAVEEGQRLAEERNTLFQWSTRFTAKSDVPTYPITRLARSVHEGILQTTVEEECDLIFLSWALGDDPSSARLGRVLDPVIRAATSDVVVFAFQPEAISKKTKGQEPTQTAEDEKSFPIGRILVTTAGGPHAPLASNLALLLAKAYGATTSGVYIAEPDASEEVLTEGQARIQKTLEVMRQQASKLPGAELRETSGTELAFEGRVIRADSVLEGIVQAGTASDLVLIGASEESVIDQVLFGTLPEAVARSCPTPVLMVKRYRGLRRFWLQRLWSTIAGMLPSLSGSERIEVYRRVRRNARPDVDFFFMMGLSAIIASYGLLQDSSAVIIGGMLVAPLFTPILAVSIAVVRGDIQLLRLAIESALKGIVLTIGVAIFITAISPLRHTGSEILSRVSPDLFDLAVALASGAAGAYAIARKDVAASLPGVAIAAALVPPLCVVGVGLALTDAQIAGGAALLFLTNLVAIVLAGSVTLLMIGFRPADRDEREARLRVGLTATLVLLILITVPLAIVFARAVEDSNTRQTINRVLLEHIGENPEMEMLDFNFTKNGSEINVTTRLYAPETPSLEAVSLWKDDLSNSLDKSVHLQLVVIPVSRVESSQP